MRYYQLIRSVFTRKSSGARPYSDCGNTRCQAKSTASYDYAFETVFNFFNPLGEKSAKVPIRAISDRIDANVGVHLSDACGAGSDFGFEPVVVKRYDVRVASSFSFVM